MSYGTVTSTFCQRPMSDSYRRHRRDELVETSQAAPEDDIPFDVLFQLLSDRVRRRILLSLSESEGSRTSIDELSNTLTAERETSRRTTSVLLYHDHLPRLADAGLLDFDRESESVRYRPDRRVERLLSVISMSQGR
ncbi:DUF7344 domain-containing protein [Haladaptatus sp. NG-WS-4]